MNNTMNIRVSIDDVKKLRGLCKELYIKANPKFNDFVITDRQLFRIVVKYYQDETY